MIIEQSGDVEKNRIVEIAGLHKWYGQLHVLRDIDLDVKNGEKIVICGPSGSGKSILIRCISRQQVRRWTAMWPNRRVRSLPRKLLGLAPFG